MKKLTVLMLGLGSLLMFSEVPSHRAEAALRAKSQPDPLVYIGTYTGNKSKGIYAFRLDSKTGALTPLGLAAETANPSFLAIHPNRKFLYAVGEVGKFQGKNSGAVTAFSIDRESGHLTQLNQQPSAGGAPCHIVVDQTGQCVLVANYSGGNVASLPVREDGSLGEPVSVIQHEGSSVNQRRQQAPHAHSINLDANNRLAIAADLGLDKLLIYRLNPAKATLVPHHPPYAKVTPGSGPRHFAFHPRGRYAYVINELTCTVTAFTYAPREGRLEEMQTISTLPPEESMQSNFSTAEVQAHPSGRFLYGSNRGHDSIVAFAIDSKTGKLRHIENESTQGKTPRNFGIDPSGRYLLAANQNSDSVVVFRIHPKTGALEPTGHTVETPTPVCVKFVP